jgi:DNA-binding transcriptional LysR family regulator
MALPSYELGILNRSVHFKNLSAAAQQVGISQPQLSRIIARLEKEFHLQLLDRTSKRHATWTPTAIELAKNFDTATRRLQEDILRTTNDAEPKTLKIGSLEGLAPIAVEYSEKLLKSPFLQDIHLDIHDVIDLEKMFLEGSLDIILTQRVPGRKKYKFLQHLGYQLLKYEGKSTQFEILSDYQLFSQKEKKNLAPQRQLVSNSLLVRKLWIDKGLGTGRLPSSVYKNMPRDSKSLDKPEDVLMIANDNFSEKLWRLIN